MNNQRDLADAIRERARSDALEVYGAILGGAQFNRHGTTEYAARCPLHADHNPSLRVNVQKALWRCDPCNKGGDVFDLYAAKYGLSARTDFVRIVEEISKTLGINGAHSSASTNGKGPGTRPKAPITPLTLAEFVKGKQLLLRFLWRNHVREDGNHLVFHYYDETGQPMPLQRCRGGSLTGSSRQFWWQGIGSPGVYGVWHLPDWRKRNASDLLLVEGETDSLTAWFYDLPCLGLPGSGTYGALQRAHFDSFQRLFIVKEPDKGGETFVAGVISRAAELGFGGRIFVVEMNEPGIKDISDLHIKYRDDPDRFEDALATLRNSAREINLAEEREKGAQGKAPTWGEPQPLPNGLPAVSVLDEYLLPESMRPWLVDIAERAQAPLDFLAAAAITALSAAVGRRCGIYPKRHDDWLVVPNLWGMIVGPPGFLKSPMLDEVLKPLVRLEANAREKYDAQRQAFELAKEAAEAERSRLKKAASQGKFAVDREKLIEDLRSIDRELGAPPTRTRHLTSDPTVEKLGVILNENPHGILLTRDELGGFLANIDRAGHENDRAFYLQGWNGYSRYTYDRIGRGTIDVDAVCVAILGAITPGPLGAYLRETFSGVEDDGLMQRFQVSVYPDFSGEWVNVDRWPDSDAKSRAVKVFERFVGFGSELLGGSGGEIPALRFDDAAQALFDHWRAELEKRIRTVDEHPVMIAHVSKYRKLMPALALIFHLCDADADSSVSLEAAERAAAWCSYLEPHAQRIYHSVTARLDTAARLLGEKIRARKLASPFTARDVYRPQWTGLTEPEDVTRALEVLEDLAWLVSDSPAATVAGGRPTLRYHINPRVWE
jgi:putative DNA primase/helicase